MKRRYTYLKVIMILTLLMTSVMRAWADDFTAFPATTTLNNAEAFDHTKVKFFEGTGTQADPYQIDDAQQLRLLAFLCRQFDNAGVLYNGKQAFHYASAHYVLTHDIDLAGVTDWRPIGELRFVLNQTPAANNECRSTQSNVFQGVFDGRGHTVRNLTMRWGTTNEYEVQNSIHGSMKQYGLFGFVGKGKSTTQADTEIKNIIIDNFRFFNDGKQSDGTTAIATTNSNRSTVGTLNANNSFSYIIGPLAAVVTHGTRITNVDVKKADATLTAAVYHMTDKNDRRIYVGGAIGTIMNNAITSPEANTNTNIKITNVATVIDVDMKKLTANKMVDVNFRSGLCVGGIVGRIHAASNKNATNTIDIKGTMFSGKIDAPLFMVGSVWGSANVVNDYNSASITNIPFQYEGKRVKNTETYFEPQYAYFHDYFINNDSRGLVEMKRDNLLPQNDGHSYVMKLRDAALNVLTQNDFSMGYQGINGGERYDVSGTVAELNQGELFNSFNASLAVDGGYKWQWGTVGSTKEFHLATGNPASAITIEQSVSGSNVTLTAVTNDPSLTGFTWTIDGVEQGDHSTSITVPAAAADRAMKVTSGSVSSAVMTLKGSVPLTFTIKDNDVVTKRYNGFEKHTHTITPSDGGTYYYRWIVYDENGKPQDVNMNNDGSLLNPTTSYTFDIRPHWLNNTYVVGVYADEACNKFVAMKTGTVPRAYLRVEDPSAEKNTFGTSTNNYLIGYSTDQATDAGIDADEAEANGARELFLISYLTNMREVSLTADARYDIEVQPNKENNVVHTTGAYYSSRYYKMMGDADFSQAAELTGKPFTPISSMSQQNPNTYSERAFMFRGTFDGQFHAVKNLYMLWRGDKVGANDYVSKWGLFGYIGGINFDVAGIAGATSYLTKQSAVVRNLIIDGAVIKHDADETSFSYNKTAPTTSTVSHAAVGVLAGIVGSYATVQNIEVRNSNINDEGSSDYDLWTRGLYVGGVIGSLQYGPASGNVQLEANGTNRNSVQYKLVDNKVENLSAHVNITIEHAKVHDTQQQAQLPLLNVGGIIGRYCVTAATLDETQAGMPRYTFFTGDIKAPNCWVSPIIASTRYKDNNGLSADKYSKQWEGNNAVAGTQLTISDALFYNYRIHDGSNYQLITDNYPYNECAWGARSMASHIDAVDNTGSYSAKEYQGVNYNATYISGSEVATMFNDDAKGGRRMALAILNSHKTNDNGLTYWRWDDAAAAPHMVTDVSRPFYSYIKKNEDIEKPNTYNVVSSDGSTNKYYVWKIDGTAQDTHTSELDIPVTATTQKVVVDVYENESVSSNESNRLAQTQYIIKLGKFTCASTIEKTLNGTLNTFTLSLKDENGTAISTSVYDITYQWYLGNVVDGDGAVARVGATTNVAEISQDVTNDYKYVLCHVTITHKESKELVFDEYVSYYVNNNQTAKVVYLYLKADGNNKADTESLTASNGKSYPRPIANGNGETPETPVWSWAEAYKKLDKYTEPDQAYITAYNTAHGLTGAAAYTLTKYDFSDEYDNGNGTYPYDTYKRDGSQRKVKPIDKCSVTWDNNVIVVMGKAMSSYFADATRMKRDDADASNQNSGTYADRPVTITGKWNGIDYYGTVINTSAHFSINADHKFENVGFGISGTERYRIYAHRWNVWAGKGILMGWEAAKHAGITATANSDHYRVNNADGSTGTPVGNFTADIAVMGGYCDDASNTNPEGWEYINHGRDDVGQQILLQSGSWGPVCPGNRQVTTTGLDTYYVMGGPDHPAKTTITIDMDRAWNDAHTEFKKGLRATVDVACLLTGNHEGTMYGDVTLNIKSGKMGRIVNGIKGAQRVINSNDKFTTNVGGKDHYRHVMKVNNEWVEVNAPAPDSYFGRGVINIIPNGGDDSKVNVIELYCGGLGRGHNDGSYHPEVCTYFYGLSEVNIYGGTFENTIYGSGAGGVNGIGTATNHTDDQGLPYWNTDRETAVDGKTPHVWYAPYEYIKKVHSYDFVKVKATPTVYRGADPMNPTPSETYTDTNLEGGYVNLEKTRNIINIYGGVFGSESNPVSIYGGGNGAASAALINPGSQQKPLGVSNYYNTPNHQAGNMYGWVDNDDDPSNDIMTSEINITGNTKIYGNIYGGGKGSMRYYRYFTRVATPTYTNAFQNYTMFGGNTKYESGTATTPNISTQSTGALWNAVQTLRSTPDNYLNLGQIYGNTKVSLGGNVEVFGNVYGGGEGVADITMHDFLNIQDAEFGLTTAGAEATVALRSNHINQGDQYVTFPEMGKIFGSAQLEVKDNVIIHGNLYGGGDAGAITGSAQVDIRDAAQIYGKVYGAGKGLTVDKSKDYTKVATIKGDTHVNLSGEGAVIWKDMFGGGENAVVTGNTNFIMTNGNVAANIYGGGEGKVDGAHITKASILKESEESTTTGNTNVSITGGKMIWDRTSLVNEKTMYRYQVIKPAVTHTNESYESRDASTIEGAKDELEANGYTDVTVTANGTRTDKELNAEGNEVDVTIYQYRVNYTEPATSKIEAREEPYSAAYLAEHTDTKVADPATATLTIGTIIDWNDEHKGTFYDYENGRFRIEHNILGGGYMACDVQGNANVHMTQGLIGMDLLKRMEWKEAYNRHEYPHFYVFGGGYGIHTKVGKSDVYVALSSKENESTGTDEQLARPRNGTAVPLNDDGDDDDSGSSMNFDIISNNYGLPDATVLGILGGGYNGHVGETKVLIGDATFTHRVYGGGLGSYEGWVEAGGPETPEQAATASGKLGTTGSTYVAIAGGHIYGDVFGGGAGVAPRKLNGSTYTDFTEIARTTGNTTVETYAFKDYIWRKYYEEKYEAEQAGKTAPAEPVLTEAQQTMQAQIFGSVYGGGDVSNVSGNTQVNLFGGNVYGYTFGAGFGRTAKESNDYRSIGRVEGNASVFIDDKIPYIDYNGGTEIEKTILVAEKFKPRAWNDVYGGGRNGVTGFVASPGTPGSTYVTLNGGYVGDNIFGGGWGDVKTSPVTSADIAGNAVVTINGGNVLWNQMANVNGDIKTWRSSNYEASGVDISMADPLFYNAEIKRFTLNHNVYGGGNAACVVGTEGDAIYTDADEVELKKTFPQLFHSGDHKTGNTIVMMNEAHIADPALFKNYADWNNEPNWSLAAMCWLATMNEQREPQFSIFGGGYGLQTKTLHDAQARVEVLAVKYGYDETAKDYKVLYYTDGSKTTTTTNPTQDQISNYGPVEHWTTGWDYAYEHKLEWTDEENDGGTAKSDLANFFPEKNWLRPNYVEAERRLRTAAFAKQIGVAGNTVMQVIGGGYNGSVGRNTLASAQSRVIVGKVYGGGFGSFEGWKEAKEIDKGTPNLVNKVGTVGGLAVVEVDRGGTVYGDVFGGGAGIESRMVDDVMTDFTEVARVDSTHVYFGKVGASEKYDFVVPIVYGSIYGGGDVANVTHNATTDLHRGQVMQYLFGGGNGRLKNQCKDYTTIGSVENANVYFHEISKKSDRTTPFSKTYGSVTQTYIHEPYVWNRTYAGGRNGIVRGNTNMVIYGGQFGHDIFGGGWGAITDTDGNEMTDDDGIVKPEHAGKVEGKDYFITSADVKGNTNITVKGGSANIDQIWDVANRKWEGLIYDENNEPYTPQYDFRRTIFLIKHNIYTGGNVACNVGTLNNEGVLADNTGDTNLTMNRGMLNSQYFESFGNPFLESWEWRDVYAKHGTPFFCLFGGGFGKNAAVYGDTNVTVDIKDDDKTRNKNISPVEPEHGHNHTWAGTEDVIGCYKDHNRMEMKYTKFPDGQSVMDVVGGGYNGPVGGTCNITVDGQAFLRNVFGGAYYSPVGSTNVIVHSGNIDNIYGGGMLGDVNNRVNVSIGQDGSNDAIKTSNSKVIVLGDVYGGNDVSGNAGLMTGNDGELTIGDEAGVNVTLRGGHVVGNVYGGGNGDYLYKIDPTKAVVTADEEYVIDDQKRLVFRVPMRADIGSYAAATDVQKIVNISTYRPVTVKTTIDIKGNAVPVDDSDDAEATADMVRVDGYVFGGGNSCTVSDFAFPSNVEYDSQNKIFKYKSTAPEALRGKEYENVSIRLGSNIRLGGVFYGSDGDAMFKAEVDNQFIRDFPNINNIKLLEMIDWKTAPGNLSLSEQYLRTPTANRPNVYKNMLDIYFMPVEMNVMPRVYFGNTESWLREAPTSAFSNAVVGTWCCGGNRGNMTTDKQMRVFLPAGLTVTGNIIGGCNNANYTLGMSDSQETISHVGGYLLGTHGKTVDITTGSVTVTDLDPQIDITVNCAFRPKSTGTAGSEIYDESCNIYGGCYLSGNINGDVRINMRSNLLSWMDQKILDRTTAANRAVGNVYGAGYGMNTYVYGDTRVQLGGNVRDAATQAVTQNSGYTAASGDTPATWAGITNGYDWTGKSSVNYIYGGGQQGTLVGNSAVRIFNGRVAGSVCGGSYAGYQYGSTQVMLGYATYYRCNVSGEYHLLRKDTDDEHEDYKGIDGKPVIKQTIHVLTGEFIPQSIYDAISGYDAAKSTTQHDNFVLVQGNAPQNFGFAHGWDDIDIVVDKAVYGGGYALASGSSVGAGVETVKKFDADHQICSSAEQNELYGIESVTGYGGNTQVTIGDNSAADSQKDHITVSSPLLQKLDLKEGDDLFGLYTRDSQGNLIYITNPDLKYHVPTGNDKGDIYYTNTYKFTGEGGVYGDGHLTLSEGFRTAEFVGYGYNGTTTKSAKLLNCIHRFDIARITDCCMSLLGDRDYAANNSTGTSSNTTPYSLARIGELQMFSSIDNATTLPALSTTVDDKLTYNKRARNYIGLSNTVRNLGAVYSDVDFDASWHGADGNMQTDASTSANYTYKSYKQAKITRNYDETNHKIKTGNPDDGNSTPYADDFNTRNTGTAKNMIGISSGYALVVQNGYGSDESNSYYGPIHGVVQIALINVRPSEAGGYVYAQNIHDVHTKFLNTSGNFVFPNTSAERRVIDDCFPHPFGANMPPATAPDNAEGHYWYVSGYKYYFNATITGYTFNSNDNPISFDMDNTNSLIALSGCKENQPVTVKYFKVVGNHKTGYDNCDIQKKFKNDAVPSTPSQEKAGYRLFFSASDKLKYSQTDTHDAPVPNIQLSNNMTEVKIKDGDNAIKTTSANPFIALQLVDNVDNNNTKKYYEDYLSDPCHAVLVLSAPVIDEGGNHVQGLTYVRQVSPVENQQYYVMTDEGEYNLITYNSTDPSSIYNAYYIQDTAPLYYEYTVNLTINYVHGPNYEGNIRVQNCALPGEMIRLSTSDLTIITDDDMPQTGGYWTFGPAEQQSDNSWKLLHENGITIEGSNVTFDESKGNMYFLRDDAKADGNYSADLKGYFLNPDNQDLYIPAYYFMNGYAAEYVFTVRGINQPIHVKIRPQDILTVHNYHRMSARPSDEANAKSIDLKMAKAVEQFRTVPTLVQKTGEAANDFNTRKNAFAAIWQSKHHRPRVFIEDQRDLMEFGAYIHGQGGTPTQVTYTPSAGGSVSFTPSALSADGGKDMDFMLMANLDIPAQYPTPDNFAGNFHGNGYTLSNRGKSESEQAALTKGLTGNVYNTGFYSTTKVRAIQGGNGKTGSIYNCFYYADDNSMPSDGVISGNVQLHNCYTNAGTSAYPGKQLLIAAQSLQPSGPEGLYLATNEAFEYGRVAYNLNQYYLDMRYKKGVNSTGYDNDGYVEQYYGNGDYLYGRYRNAANAGPEFYRTTVRPNYPNGDYDMLVTLVMGGQSITRHDTSHPTDEARAYYETGFKEYRPLFNENKHNTTASVGADVRNDYIFFGQHLNNTKPSDGINYTKQVYPSHIVNTSNTVSSMRNRVYRAYGYYGSSSDNAFHFNTQVFAMDANLTAIDFTGFHDTNVADEPSDATWTTENQNGWYQGTKIVPSKYSIHYPPMLDMPKSFMVSANAKDLNVCEGVTRNLLVYTPAADGGANVGGTTPAENTYSIVRNSIGYTEATPESDIVAHQVVKKATYSTGESAYETELFHLVERANGDEPNNDFNAPIAYDVTNRAWYTRQPKYYRDVPNAGYGNGSAWEGIALPFTVNKVVASLNGEITHFYGMPTQAMIDNPNINDRTLHHEYWLNGLVSISSADGTTTAKFQRPGAADDGLFAPEGGAVSTDYHFNNKWFYTTYESTDYLPQEDSEVKGWYNDSHTFAGYQLLTAYVPYIVSFPGYSFYEFDLSSRFYNEKMGTSVAEQTVTFSNTPLEGEYLSIGVTDDDAKTTTANGFKHQATYCVIEDAAYGINGDGTSFDASVRKVLPFRTYMATAPSGARDYNNVTRGVIYIGTANDEGIISEEQLRPGDPDTGIVENGMRIFVQGNRLLVESTYASTLSVHTYGGQLVRILDVTEGTNTYTGFAPGMYIVNGKKLVIRR